MNPFDRVVCISLARREDRWKQFTAGLPSAWPFGEVEKYTAIDGKLCRPPEWFMAGGGAWGCNQSHTRVIEECLNRGHRSVLLLEDDAVFTEDFTPRWNRFFADLPQDWEVLYLGGQHLKANNQVPVKITDHVYAPYNVNRTHAWALRGRGMVEMYRHMMGHGYGQGGMQIIDNHMGRLVQRGELHVYCPDQWLAQQREGLSDISNKDVSYREWIGAEDVTPPEAPRHRRQARGGRKQGPRPYLQIVAEHEPLVVVLGTHSSGSSCLAGTLHHLGVHMGDRFTGFYGSRPDQNCGFEPVGLIPIVQGWVRWPNNEPHGKRQVTEERLMGWILARHKTAKLQGQCVGMKHPMLSCMGDMLESIAKDNLILIHAARPLEESIESFVRREKKSHAPAVLEAHQRWLSEQKEALLARHPGHLTVDYAGLLADPRTQCQRIAEYLKIEPTDDQYQKALQWIAPGKRHVNLQTA